MKDSAQLDAAKASLQWPWQPWKWNDVLVYSRAHLMVMVSEANHLSSAPMTFREEKACRSYVRFLAPLGMTPE